MSVVPVATRDRSRVMSAVRRNVPAATSARVHPSNVGWSSAIAISSRSEKEVVVDVLTAPAASSGTGALVLIASTPSPFKSKRL